ncbi:MAG TPA: glutamine--fructose-6-phosphate transaminase (isomerizing) [Bacteroidota bacterium]|nr:glutamine--fructose-6-phosphate transaminase (isomerizing) [Bacteroidota bacterium]
MCGIVGYIGDKSPIPLLIDGLRRLEYRGYDSSGIAIVSGRSLQIAKKVGKVDELASSLEGLTNHATAGIAHTRWATHGEPSMANAHPHCDCTGSIAIVHNGIIENYAALRKKLEANHRFVSGTDTEVIAHLIEDHLKSEKNFETAVRKSLAELEGTFGLAILFAYEPRYIIAARRGSPLVIGVGNQEYFLASDATAFRRHTDMALFLNDNEIAVISAKGVSVKDINDMTVERDPEEIDTELEELERSGFPHFMLKEIFEQPKTIQNALRGRIDESRGTAVLGGISDFFPRMLDARRLIIVGCGTSWHAGLIGEYMLEQYVNIPVEVEYASEFRYRSPVLDKNDVVIAISQSGETADTLAALREAKKRGATVLGICNAVGSSIARECDAGLFMYAGQEIGVASTKAFTSQVVILALITLALARQKSMSREEGLAIVQQLLALPQKIGTILAAVRDIHAVAEEFYGQQNFLYLGRGFNFPSALEGALKLKEISYIHAEGYPAAEMKHGPIALIDANMPVVILAPHDHTYGKIIGNIQEVKARKGKIIAITDDVDEQIVSLSDFIIRIPPAIDMLAPILSIIPLQLLAYYMAVLRGCNVDQPRNLAKSVTVE